MGDKASIEFQPLRQPLTVQDVRVTFFPAGHILGSAQVRIERGGRTMVVSGDYKRQTDPTCQPFEPVLCQTFVTESTFGLPIYRWPDSQSVVQSINQWWRGNREAGKASLLFAYSLGKAQRILMSIDQQIGPVYTHGAIERLNEGYRDAGVKLPPTTHVGQAKSDCDWSRALILAPPSAAGTPWIRRFGRMSTAMASGWMQIRGTRRRRALDRGFVLSDHADWHDLLRSISETTAEEVWVTHGYADVVARHLRESGQIARALSTRFTGAPLIESHNDVDHE